MMTSSNANILLAIGAGNSPVNGEFPAQKASNVENVSIWWRHHKITRADCLLRVVMLFKK